MEILDVNVSSNVDLYGEAKVYGNAQVYENAYIDPNIHAQYLALYTAMLDVQSYKRESVFFKFINMLRRLI